MALLRTMLVASLVVVGAAIPAAAHAQRGGVAITDGDAAARWVAQRVRMARRGHADRVAVPFAVASVGWGCDCPNAYIGDDPDSGGGPWLDVVLAEGVTLPTAGNRGAVYAVEGYFSGEVSYYHSEDPVPPYLLYRFVVTRVVRRLGQGAPTPLLRVLAAGAYACTSKVNDPDPPLHVRSRATTQADVVGDAANGTLLTVDDVRPEWLHVTAPVAGWVYAANVQATCLAPAPPPCCAETHPN